MRTRSLSGCTVAVLAALLPAMPACEDRPATQVVISIATDLTAPDPLRHLSMTLERFDEEQNVYAPVDPGVTKEWDIGTPPVAFELPGTVVTYSGTEQEPRLRVTLFAHDRDGVMLRRQTVFRLVREKLLYMRMGIAAKCFDNADCPMEKTCIEGRCRDPEFFRLPEYQPGKQPDLKMECFSGTQFRNTTTGLDLERTGRHLSRTARSASKAPATRATCSGRRCPPRSR